MWIISISSPQEIKMLAEYFRIPINASIHDGQQMGDTENFIPNEIKGDFYQTMEDFGLITKVFLMMKKNVFINYRMI